MDESEIIKAVNKLRNDARKLFPEHQFLSASISAHAGLLDPTNWSVRISGNGAVELAMAWDAVSIDEGIAEVRRQLNQYIRPADAWAIIGAEAA